MKSCTRLANLNLLHPSLARTLSCLSFLTHYHYLCLYICQTAHFLRNLLAVLVWFACHVHSWVCMVMGLSAMSKLSLLDYSSLKESVMNLRSISVLVFTLLSHLGQISLLLLITLFTHSERRRLVLVTLDSCAILKYL